MAKIITTPIVGPSLSASAGHDSAKLPVGTMATAGDGGLVEYCGPAISTCSANTCVLIYEQGTIQMTTTTLVDDAGSGKKVGFTNGMSIASAYYGWVWRQGRVATQLADDCADNVPLFTTATAGVLDDATISNCLVLGVILPVTASLATALTVIAGCPAIIAPYTNPA